MIDAHQHVWRIGANGCDWPTPAEGAIFRDYGLDDFRAKALPLGVRRTVLVQSQEDDRDTNWLLELAAANDIVAAVIGWTDFAAPDAPAHIIALASDRKLAGLRPMVQDRAADWYDDPALGRAFTTMAEHDLRLDALVRPRHLAALDRLAGRLPDLGIVIDHGAKPRIAESGGFARWHEAIAPLAERPNVWCKLSGLLAECAGAPPEAIGPYVEAMLALFGPQRLMWGSDWPVLETAAGYGDWLALARRLFPAVHHDDIFERTAERFYRIEAEAMVPAGGTRP